MLRHLYRYSVRVHPFRFRKRFGDEMLYIFDQQKGTVARLGLLLDSVFSLLRQWTFRAHLGINVPAASVLEPVTNAPSLLILDSFCPRTSAIVNGTVLSLILFCLTCFAIRYSWIHVLQVHIREISFDSKQQIRPSDYSAPSSNQPIAVDSEKSHLISEQLQVDVIPVEPEGTSGIEKMTSRNPDDSAVFAPAPVVIQLRLELYTGKYISHSPPLKISIGREGDHLSLVVAGRSRRALSPVSQTKFAVAGANDGWVEFTPDDRGRFRSLSLFQSGNVIVAQRQ